MILARQLERAWYRGSVWLWLLWPLSVLYRAVVFVRRLLARPWRAPVPVVVVGNISVGGTGKTPVVLALVERLRAQGYRPGIASRGYGGRGPYPLRVGEGSDASACGDEPLMLWRRSGAPLTVHPRRVAAVADLVARGCDVVVCDDGLQHLALARDLAIAVVDGERGLGNGHCLPMGPLREPPARLRSVDLVLVNGGAWRPPTGTSLRFELRPVELVSLTDGRRLAPGDWSGPRRVHALAGIGHPQRFFATLRSLGFDPVEHALPDHQALTSAHLAHAAGEALIMTEKDAARLPAGASGNLWYLAVDAVWPEADSTLLDQALRGLRESSQ